MSLPALDSFLVSETFAIDVASGRMSVFNMIDSLFVPSLPALWPKFTAVASYDVGAEARTFDDRVSVRGHDDVVLAESVNHIEMSGQQINEPITTHRSVHLMWRTKLMTASDLHVVLERRSDANSPWEVLHRKRIALRIGPHPLHGPGSAAPPPSAPPSPSSSS